VPQQEQVWAYLGSCRLGNCTFGKLPFRKIPLGSCHLGQVANILVNLGPGLIPGDWNGREHKKNIITQKVHTPPPLPPDSLQVKKVDF